MRITGVPFVQGRNSYTDSDGTKHGIAIHNTSNDATAEQEASYATRRTDGISAHLYVDNNSIVQSLDTSRRAGHAGSNNGNQNAVAVEITGVNGWTRQQWLDRVVWDKLGAALAQVVRKYGIAVRRASVAEMKSNPRVKAFYGHDDMRRAWGGTTHTDPGPNFPWDRLFQAVNAALGKDTEDDMEQTEKLRYKTGYTSRTVGQAITDLSNLRDLLTGDPKAHNRPAAGSPIMRLLDVPAQVDALLKAAAGQKADEIVAEIRRQGEQTRAAVAGVVPAVIEALPEGDGPVSRDDLVAALTTVLGSLDGASPTDRQG